MEKGVLRQGDVLGSVHLLGAVNLGQVAYASPQGSTKPTSCVLPTPVFGPAAVLSHSCEIDTSNSVKLTSVILAPLRELSKAAPPEKLVDLIASNDIERASAGTSFLKYFVLDPLPMIGYSDSLVVDFSKCFSVHKSTYKDLVTQKIAQLDNDTRDAFALKLALFFRR